MSSDLLVELLQALDGPQGRYAEQLRYYRAEQNLTFLAPESQAALGRRFPRLGVNIPKLAVNAIAERLRVRAIETR